jgi:hypothetical protein
MFSRSPIVLLYVLFVFLYCILRNYICDVARKLAYAPCKRRFDFYSDIEDRLFLEEYEDPEQEFDLRNFEEDYKMIQ